MLKLILILLLLGLIRLILWHFDQLETYCTPRWQRIFKTLDGIGLLALIVRFAGLPLGETEAVMAIALFYLIYFLIVCLYFLICRWIRPLRKKNSVLFACLLCLAAALGFSRIGWLQASALHIRHHEVTLQSRYPHPDLQLTVLSDVHLGTAIRTEQLPELISALKAQETDMILILGDLFDEYTSVQQLEEFLTAVDQADLPPVLMIAGNHEYHQHNAEQYFSLIQKSSISLVRDDILPLDDKLSLILRQDKSQKRKTLDELIGTADQDWIVLDHQPVLPDASSPILLQLSGHTHDGQVYPFSLAVSLAYPCEVGQCDLKDATMIVTSGAGAWGLPFRLGTESEILNLTLHFTA